LKFMLLTYRDPSVQHRRRYHGNQRHGQLSAGNRRQLWSSYSPAGSDALCKKYDDFTRSQIDLAATSARDAADRIIEHVEDG
jgi:hypothetical protein